MRAFSCVIYLNGEIKNQVRKVLTAPEIYIMRWLHGNDAVNEIALWGDYAKYKGVDRWPESEERERLKTEYDEYLMRDRGARKPTSIDAMFGTFNRLPDTLPDFDDDEFEDDEQARDSVAAKAKKAAAKTRGRPPKSARPAERTTPPAPAEFADFEDGSVELVG